jgi:hypothetical protein
MMHVPESQRQKTALFSHVSKADGLLDYGAEKYKLTPEPVLA